MSDDALNKKIKEAAEQYHPAYDEDAWKKMELALDKHMPEKKKRRFFYLPFFVLLLGGLFYILYSPHGKVQPVEKNLQAKKSGMPAASSKQGEISPKTIPHALSKKDKTGSDQRNEFFQTTRVSKLKITATNGLNSTKTRYYHVAEASGDVKSANNISAKQDNDVVLNKNTGINNNDSAGNDQSERVVNLNNSKSVDSTTQVQDSTTQVRIAATIKSSDGEQDKLKKPSKQKGLAASEKSFAKNFAISISAGPDVSSISMSRIGRVDLNYGVGFSYALSKKVILRTGFYIADKIYSADTSEYKLPYGSNTNYLYDINANCIVYNIPLSVSYTFQETKHDWFVSAGLSSYLMKKETYKYLYKYPSGFTDEKTWAIYNKNHHYFSVLNVSAGYEYLFSKRTSLIAEPYVQLPLSGIGAGKVKLNSAGILFTLKVKPFLKK